MWIFLKISRICSIRCLLELSRLLIVITTVCLFTKHWFLVVCAGLEVIMPVNGEIAVMHNEGIHQPTSSTWQLYVHKAWLHCSALCGSCFAESRKFVFICGWVFSSECPVELWLFHAFIEKLLCTSKRALVDVNGRQSSDHWKLAVISSEHETSSPTDSN